MSLIDDLNIREIKSKDYDSLVVFFDKNNVREVIRMFNPFPLSKKSAFTIACMDHLDHYYAAHVNDQLIGFCMLRGWDEGYQIPSFGVLVDQRFQNLGVGRKLSVYAIKEAIKFGCPRIRLSVYASNKAAIQLYLSLGFVEESRVSAQVFGELDEKIIMYKDLLNIQ